jgi:hypothetical protein
VSKLILSLMIYCLELSEFKVLCLSFRFLRVKGVGFKGFEFRIEGFRVLRFPRV